MNGPSGLAVPAITLPELMVTTARDGKSVLVRMTGVADMRSTRPVSDYFAALHRECIRSSIRDVTVDVRDLEFMSASCFRSLVRWLGSIGQELEGKRYRVIFQLNAERHWQVRTLEALATFGGEVVAVES